MTQEELKNKLRIILKEAEEELDRVAHTSLYDNIVEAKTKKETLELVLGLIAEVEDVEDAC